MKKIIMAGVILAGVIGYAKADTNITPKQLAENLSQVPIKLQGHISNEIEKTKQYQAKQWNKIKSDLLKLKAKFIKQ